MSFPSEQGPRPDPSGLFFNVVQKGGWIKYRHIDEHGRRSTVMQDIASPDCSKHFDDGEHRVNANGTLLAASTDGSYSLKTPDGIESTTYADGSVSIVEPLGRTIHRTADGKLTIIGHSELLGQTAVAQGFVDSQGTVHRTSIEPINDIGDKLLGDGDPPQ